LRIKEQETRLTLQEHDDDDDDDDEHHDVDTKKGGITLRDETLQEIILTF